MKKYRSYTVHEVTSVLGVHKNTVREWIRAGLPTLKGRPVLILGADLIDFLVARRKRKRRPCGPGQMYCFICRTPQFPAGGMIDFAPMNSKVANLTGICPVCYGVMHRCVSATQIEEMRNIVGISLSRALPSLNEIRDPIAKRNRALIAFTLLTGARDSAIASMKLKHVNLMENRVYQDAREVQTKFSKTFTTCFFPVGEEVRAIVGDWITHLREKLLWGNDDPLFPATRVEVSQSSAISRRWPKPRPLA